MSRWRTSWGSVYGLLHCDVLMLHMINQLLRVRAQVFFCCILTGAYWGSRRCVFRTWRVRCRVAAFWPGSLIQILFCCQLELFLWCTSEAALPCRLYLLIESQDFCLLTVMMSFLYWWIWCWIYLVDNVSLCDCQCLSLVLCQQSPGTKRSLQRLLHLLVGATSRWGFLFVCLWLSSAINIGRSLTLVAISEITEVVKEAEEIVFSLSVLEGLELKFLSQLLLVLLLPPTCGAL